MKRYALDKKNERLVAKYLKNFSRERHLAQEASQLRPIVVPALRAAFGKLTGLQVLELGPQATTAVAAALQTNCKQYVSIGLSVEFAKKQREFLSEELPDKSAQPMVANSEMLPFADGCFDVVVAVCHDPFVSGPTSSLAKVAAEAARVLKEDGALVIHPWYSAGGEKRPDFTLLKKLFKVSAMYPYSAQDFDERQGRVVIFRQIRGGKSSRRRIASPTRHRP